MSRFLDLGRPSPLPVRLSERAQYITPTGRFCRWWPAIGKTRNADGELFLYHQPDGSPATRGGPRADGFFLTEANLRILRRVG